MPRKLDGNFIQTGSITTTQLSTTVTNQISAGGGPRVTTLVYPGNDTAANTVGGQTVYINGSGFETNNAIYINGNAVPSKSFISASNLSFTTPALSAGLYPIYVINTDTGATAILIPGILISGEPAWVTAAGSLSESQDELSAWSYTLSATGDTPITYALAAGSSLPTGVSLAANGLISGTITSPSGNTTTYTFSVVATDAQNQDSTRQFTVTTSTGEGVLFANNVLLIHADGTNNQNNHTFLDSSNNNFTITRNGNATQGSFSPFSQTGWSNYFDGVDDNLSISAGSGSWADFGSGAFTIEAWIFPRTVSVLQGICGTHAGGTNTWQLRLNSATLEIFGGGGGGTAYAGGSVAANTWTHVAVSRSGTNVYVFVNGSLTTRSVASGDTFPASTNVTIGNLYSSPSAYWFNGYISNLRILKGTALYTSAFTVPSSPLTDIANTQLLTCQSNRFFDSSTNARAITIAGAPSVQAYSPFAPTAAYTTANVGGSGYFDGTDDYLRITDNAAFDFGSGDFTIECWAYTETFASQYNVLVCQWGSSTAWIFRIQSTLIGLYANIGGTQNYTASVTNTTGQWDHFAVTRSGTTLTFYKNGVSVGTTSISGTINNAAETISIGVLSEYNSTTTHKGYISGLRVIKGSAIAPTITSPPTNIANTSLLCNFTNAGIFDQTAKNVLETVGDAKVSTTQYKYGTGSIGYDGTGDYLLVAPTPNLEFGSGDFTIEFWWYPTSTSRQGLYHGSFGTDWSVGIDYGAAAGKIGIWASSTGSSWNLITADNSQGQGTTTVTQNAWNHIAYVRSGTTWMLFVNGNRDLNLTGISGTIVNRASSQKAIGVWWSTGSMSQASGYMDDFRITKGYARYTSNFTPPSSALKDK